MTLHIATRLPLQFILLFQNTCVFAGPEQRKCFYLRDRGAAEATTMSISRVFLAELITLLF